MRVRTTPAVGGELNPIPAKAHGRESIAVTWCRQIATSVATALDSPATALGYRLTVHTDLPVPHLLHARFTVRGHHVAITVVWHDPPREPTFALTVDRRAVPLDTSTPAPTAAVLAHAACHAITDADQATAVR